MCEAKQTKSSRRTWTQSGKQVAQKAWWACAVEFGWVPGPCWGACAPFLPSILLLQFALSYEGFSLLPGSLYYWQLPRVFLGNKVTRKWKGCR